MARTRTGKTRRSQEPQGWLMSSHTLELVTVRVAWWQIWPSAQGFCTSRQATSSISSLLLLDECLEVFSVAHMQVVRMITTSKRRFLRQVRRWDFEQPERLLCCDVDFKREAFEKDWFWLLLLGWAYWPVRKRRLKNLISAYQRAVWSERTRVTWMWIQTQVRTPDPRAMILMGGPLGVFMENEKFKLWKTFWMCSADYSWNVVFTSGPNLGSRFLLSGFPWFFGVDLVDDFLREKWFMDITKSQTPDGNCCVESRQLP